MTTTPRSPRLLLISTLTLVVTGGLLLVGPHGRGGTPSSAAPPKATKSLGPPPQASSLTEHETPDSAPAATPTSTPAPTELESALPPHGDGPAGDRAIQKALETAWPADLPARDERPLLTAGRALLRADATGIGRAQWRTVFPESGQAMAPAFAASHFRIQAAIARRDGSPNKAVVHLVWAGTDRGGTYTDGRITDLFFARTLKEGASMWTWQPRI